MCVCVCRVEKEEAEAKSSLEKFEEISKRWLQAKLREVPQELRDALNSQTQLCATLIEDKNKLITDLQQVHTHGHTCMHACTDAHT